MDSESLPPIPTPPGQRWREFRVRVMPLFVFVLALVAMVLVWSRYVEPVLIVGLVETNAVNVTTTQAGLLTTLAVNRFDEVTNGQVLGEVAPYDPQQLQAELAAIESDAYVVKSRMELNELGNLDNSAQLRLNLFLQKALLNMAKVGLQEAEVVVKRDEELMKPPNPVVTTATYQVDLAKRNTLKSEVEDRTKLVEEWSKELDYMAPVRTNVYAQLERVVQDNILRQQEQLRQLQKPIVLRAPINGKISSVLHRAGERVTAGSPVLMITTTEAQQIVAYVRQPINFRPKLGDVVTVRTRTIRRRASDAQVVKVGTQLEAISPFLQATDRPRAELGLPIALTLPPELNLLPGEVVDIRLAKNWIFGPK